MLALKVIITIIIVIKFYEITSKITKPDISGHIVSPL